MNGEDRVDINYRGYVILPVEEDDPMGPVLLFFRGGCIEYNIATVEAAKVLVDSYHTDVTKGGLVR